MKWPPPLVEKLGTIVYFKKQMLGIKGMEMDSGVSHLTIVHSRVYFNPKTNNSNVNNLRELYLEPFGKISQILPFILFLRLS